MKDQLALCPFCGGEANIGTIKYPKDSEQAKLNRRNTGYFPQCIQCPAKIEFGLSYATEEEAIKAWNRRPK